MEPAIVHAMQLDVHTCTVHTPLIKTITITTYHTRLFFATAHFGICITPPELVVTTATFLVDCKDRACIKSTALCPLVLFTDCRKDLPIGVPLLVRNIVDFAVLARARDPLRLESEMAISRRCFLCFDKLLLVADTVVLRLSLIVLDNSLNLLAPFSTIDRSFSS